MDKQTIEQAAVYAPRVPLSMSSTISAVKDHLCCDLSGEAVILNLATGTYYGLDSISARIWELLQKPVKVNDISNVLLNEYEVEPARCARDITLFLEKLLANELVEIHN